MKRESCIYEGRVRHRRFHGVDHAFEFPLFMMYLDLDELAHVFRGRWLWSVERANLASFRREDHMGDPADSLRGSIERCVESELGRRPTGPIRLLTHLRYAGHVFNPVSIYYCFESDGHSLEAVVAEVNNTPWGERHCYVIDATRRAVAGGPLPGRTPKDFHVSPFLGMEMAYRWTLPTPRERLRVGIVNEDPDGARLFDAHLSMERREITGLSLARVLARYPMISVQVLAGIYWQAFRLKRKGATWHPHPRLEAAPLEMTS